MKDSEMRNFDVVTIGYYDDTAVYLLPNETWHVLQKYCLQEGSHFPFSRSTFYKLLLDRGLLAPTKDGQPTSQKKVQGNNQRVLKLVRGGLHERFVTSATDSANN